MQNQLHAAAVKTHEHLAPASVSAARTLDAGLPEAPRPLALVLSVDKVQIPDLLTGFREGFIGYSLRLTHANQVWETRVRDSASATISFREVFKL